MIHLILKLCFCCKIFGFHVKALVEDFPFVSEAILNFLGGGRVGVGGGGVNTLHEKAGCHCSCGAGEAMSPLLKSRCTTL